MDCFVLIKIGKNIICYLSEKNKTNIDVSRIKIVDLLKTQTWMWKL
jgi:hypothetical protein